MSKCMYMCVYICVYMCVHYIQFHVWVELGFNIVFFVWCQICDDFPLPSLTRRCTEAVKGDLTRWPSCLSGQ